MFVTAGPQPAVAGQARAGSFSLAATAFRRFGPGQRRIDDDFSVRHFTDLTAGYGLSYRPELAAPAGNTFSAMATALWADLRQAGDAPVDLGIVAHATPDLDCRLAATTYLAEVLAPGGLSFAVSESGSCAGHTALRLVQAYAGDDGPRTAVVLILDQATLPYETRLPPDLAAAGDAGVALLLTSDGTGAPVRVWEQSGVPVAQVPVAVRAALREFGAPQAPVRLINGTGADLTALAVDVGAVRQRVHTRAGYRAGGTWSELSRLWSEDDVLSTVVVDHDRLTGDLGVCAVGPWGRPS